MCSRPNTYFGHRPNQLLPHLQVAMPTLYFFLHEQICCVHILFTQINQLSLQAQTRTFLFIHTDKPNPSEQSKHFHRTWNQSPLTMYCKPNTSSGTYLQVLLLQTYASLYAKPNLNSCPIFGP